MPQAFSSSSFDVLDLGLMPYEDAYRIQKQTVLDVIAGKRNTLFFCEHPPVFTLGRLADEQHFLLSQKEICARGAKIVRIDRGGEVTFHGPGQLVIYPIFRIRDWGADLHRFLKKLEEVAIDLLRDFGIVANVIAGQRGVWVADKKIVSIGVGVRKWVSFHGLAINVNTELSYFEWVHPCGLKVQMTSLEKLLNRRVPLKDVALNAVTVFERHFSNDSF